MSEWISVNDKLPECNGYGIEVIAYLNEPLKHGKMVCMYTFFRGEWISINGSTWPNKPEPTHWMPLPQPPEK